LTELYLRGNPLLACTSADWPENKTACQNCLCEH
jgi:hypothetical protein